MLVLVTAISGYIGSATALAFLQAGHRVRGTVRSEAKAAAWKAAYPEWREQVEFVVVPDMSVQGSYDLACEGVEWIAHVASPFTFGELSLLFCYTDNERDMLQPAIRGTLEILEAAHKTSSVSAIVITSSFAAVQDYTQGLRPGYTYSEKDWCPLSYEEAMTSEDKALVYIASKKLAEEAAWRFMETEKPAFTLSTSILPALVLGRAPQPLTSLNDLNTSASWIRAFIDAEALPPAPIPAMVDIHDVALSHLRALERTSATAGRRYLTIAHKLDPAHVASILRRRFPEHAHRFPREEKAEEESWGWDVRSTEKDLGIEWKSIEQTIVEAAAQVFELENKEAVRTSAL
ncbi:NAD-P-binding protein [Leucosporidium creatinivorum]|uniref:NAD-P-binding protein n=1 Tax=Leucosporidium creatinivorum TaxID=106004 RepID=A0A1Y2G3P6_9BASI|nr:NAD-P-binding protein [Leucosporidium creatinivorum]